MLMNTTSERSFYIIYIREPALRPAITLHIMYHCITEKVLYARPTGLMLFRHEYNRKLLFFSSFELETMEEEA